MAKITRTQQRRLVATSVAFIFTAALMMPTVTDARGGGHGGGGHGGHGGSVGILGFGHHRTSPPVGYPFGVARVPFSSRHTFTSHPAFTSRRAAFGHSNAIGSDFFGFGAGSVWFDEAAAPTIVIVQEPSITHEPALPRATALVRAPDPEQDGILVVRGTSKAYVTFPGAKRG